MKSAVSILIPQNDSRALFLAASRRNDQTKWGLPGGKVDPGETNVAAAVRELYEETGVILDPVFLEPIYCAVCPGKGKDDTYWVTTYLWTGAPVTQPLETKEPGIEVRWLCAEALQDPRHSPFAAYNQGVFAAMHKQAS